MVGSITDLLFPPSCIRCDVNQLEEKFGFSLAVMVMASRAEGKYIVWRQFGVSDWLECPYQGIAVIYVEL